MIFFAYMKSSMSSYSYRIHFKLLACGRICVHKRLDYFIFLISNSMDIYKRLIKPSPFISLCILRDLLCFSSFAHF
jgi:hypothetical protein